MSAKILGFVPIYANMDTLYYTAQIPELTETILEMMENED